METNNELIRAAQAILVAVQCDAANGGDLARRLHAANPLCVNLLHDALEKSGNLPQAK